MRREHRPKQLKRFTEAATRFYAHRFLEPHFDSVGDGLRTVNPWLMAVNGGSIHLGRSALLAAMPDRRLMLTTVRNRNGGGQIRIGNFCLLSPGVRIESNQSVTIGDNCMLAANAYIGDSDWHGLYNRLTAFRCTAPVVLGDNVWIGMGAVVTKGVNIGENAIVGAGSIVTKDVAANTVVAGNPAKVVKRLNPRRRFLKRDYLLADAERADAIDQELLDYITAGNSWANWLRTLIYPLRGD